MFEIHLFVNPVGMRCYKCEQDVLRADENLDAKIDYQFVPIFSMQTIEDTLNIYGLDHRSMDVRASVSDIMYQVILDYKSALFQGKRRGHHYLLAMQKELLDKGWNYSSELAFRIAEESDLDTEMFMEDRHSALAKKAFEEDQAMTTSLGITETGTAVVYNSKEPEYGYIISSVDYESLMKSYNNLALQPEPKSFKSFVQMYHSNIRIIKSN
ncbi:MAG: DsbA family protein [Limosilactobacillus sp.]|uniref:DsbA family protein n=1 Tax=Limosilactobacillus sp. TaxID=2773925 RepID=UPI002708A292|nr:DsbA family protein [Limosilactobacillus sp.]